MDATAPILARERLAHTKTGYLIACRFGDPSFPHVINVSRCRYDNRDGEMRLTEQLVEMTQALPGSPGDLIHRLAELKPKAEERAQDGLGEVRIVVDVTRSPEMWRLVNTRLAASVFLIVTTHGRLMDSTPYWLVGRVTLLSHLATTVALGLMRFAPPPADNPQLWTPEQVREAFTAARNRPPKSEADEYLTDTTTNDDVALVAAASAMYAERFQPDPWVDLDDRPVRFAEGGY